MNSPGPEAWPLPRPTFAGALALMGGQGLVEVFGDVPREPLLGALLLAMGAFLAAVDRRWFATAAWITLFALLGAYGEARVSGAGRLGRAWVDENQYALARYAEVEGTVDRVADHGAAITLWLAPGATVASGGALSRHPAPLPVRVPPTLAASPFTIGGRVQFSGKVRELEHSLRADSIDRYQRSRGAVMAFGATQVLACAPEHAGVSAAVLRMMSRSREAALDAVRRGAPDGRGALLAAMMLGETEGLARGTYVDFQRTGLVHLFSVSGLHTMLVGMLTLTLLGYLGLPRWLRAATFLCALTLFAGMAGFEKPVLRASLLLAMSVLGEFIDRPVDSLAALSAAFLVLAIPDPAALHTIEFQLTFLCALVLVLAQPWRIRLQETLGRRVGWSRSGRVFIFLIECSAISVLIQLVTTPVLASWFGEVSLVSPVANALLAIPAGLLIIAGFLAALLGAAFPMVGDALLGMIAWPVDWLGTVAGWLATPTFASVPGAHWPAGATALWLVAILASPWAVERVRVPVALRGTVVVSVLILPVALAIRSDAWNAPVLRVVFIDVGQGDAILLETRDGVRALVDAGPDARAARWLELHGIDRLDWVAATHADFDHIGGMPEVFECASVGELLTNGPLAGSDAAAELAGHARSRGATVRQLSRGDRFILGTSGVTIDVLHPSSAFVAENPERNEGSLVLRVIVPGGGSLLLTGDAEESAERDMLAAGLIGGVDLLKAGHHGSATSTTEALLAAASPRIAIMSCGIANNFGHPDPGVLDRAAAVGAAIWRTDRDGTITVSFHEDGVIVVEGSRREGRMAYGR